MSRPRSRWRALWVRAPEEMTSTPVRAMSPTVPRVTVPLASTIARPATCRTPAARSASEKLSSMRMSTPPASTGSIWSRRSTSTSSRVVWPSRARARRIASVRSTPCWASTARWLSLAITASEREKRWFTPPPQRTACRSRARRPGVVLRVSVMRAPVPSTASTMARVAVAIPDIRCTRFSAIRSAWSTARAGPVTVASTSPVVKRSPSARWAVSSVAGSVRRNAAATTSIPASTPSSRAVSWAVAVAPAGRNTSPVRSPQGASSARAAVTTGSIWARVSMRGPPG